jgi:hypothetical protein
MPSTVEALAVVLAAVLPGGLYVWAFERQVGAWGVSLADRLLRFIATSALFHLAAAPVSYLLWRDHLREGFTGPEPTLPLWLWAVTGTYIALPIALGVVIGQGVLKGRRLALLLAGSNAAPTAWDFLFSPNPNGWVRCKLKSGAWIGGAFADGSYAGGHPEPGDLFIVRAADIDQQTGEFRRDDDGNAILRASGVLVRWEEVEYLDFETG